MKQLLVPSKDESIKKQAQLGFALQDIADCLWSLASMDMRVIRHLRHLQREVELRVGDMSERDLATVTWSFASLRHNPGALLDLIAEAASPRLPAFETRVIVRP